MSRRLKLLAAAVTAVAAVTAAVVVDTDGNGSGDRPAAVESALPRGACDKVASPRGSDGNRRHGHEPVRDRGEARQLAPAGETGCLRAGVYRGRVKIRKGGARRTRRRRSEAPRVSAQPCGGGSTWPTARTTSWSGSSSSTGATARTCPARRSTGTTPCFGTTTSRPATRPSASCSAPGSTAARGAR